MLSSKVIGVWLFVCFVAVVDGAEEPKRDKRTVDVLLRGAADLFGYDVVRRITSPALRQSAPRPTFFPPPVARQLPSGTYSRVILALGQQQQQEQQQMQRQREQELQVTNPFQPLGQLGQQQQQAFSLEDLRQPQQRTTILNIPQNGALTASAESINLPPGGHILPVLQVPAQVPFISALQAQPVIPVSPFGYQSTALRAQIQPMAAPQQAAPAPAPPTAAAQQNAAPQNAQNPIGIPLQIVAIPSAQNLSPDPQNAQQNAPQNAAPQQSQNTPQQPQQQQNGAQMPASASSATQGASSGTNAQQTQPQQPNNGVSIVLDQGPTRWNLFSLPPRPESVRRSLNLNLNWNRNVEPGSPAQFQLVPVPLETTPASAQAGQQGQSQQQQLAAPSPTIEDFDITTAAPSTNSAFNRYYNVPDNFQARTAAQTQNDNNVKFRESVRQFWQSTPWSGSSESPRRASLQEELRPRFEEYNLENNAEELNAPDTEQIIQEQNEIIAPSEEVSREALNDSNEGNQVRSRRYRLNSDRFDEETKESSDAPKFRRKNKIRRIRKVKKSVDNSDESKLNLHQIYKREKKSLPDEQQTNAALKSYYKKFTASK